MFKVINILISAMLILSLVACSSDENSRSVGPSQSVSSKSPESLGDLFLSSNLKIQSTIEDHSVTPKRTCTVELYVDGEGDGQGLLGFGEQVFDIVVVNDVVYIVVDATLVIGISDITGRMVFSDTALQGYDDLSTLGFTLETGGNPITYAARQDTTSIDTRYAQSVNEFETASVVSTVPMMKFNESIVYIMDYLSEQQVDVEDEDDAPTVTDFYLESKYGIEIDGQVFSVGDTCNVSTYFNSLTPEGLVDSYVYRQDERVDFVNASYISNTGRTVFTLMGDYVQAINTTADFSFLGIERGIDEDDLTYLLGYKLSRKEEETWTPIDSDLVVTGNKGQVYFCTVGNLYIEFRCTKNVLTEIYMEQTLDFKG